MRTATVLTLALGTTALIAPLNGTAFAQQAAFEGSCGELATLIEEAGGELREEFADAVDVASGNDVEVCTAYIVRVEEAGGLALAGAAGAEAGADAAVETETFSDSETVTQTVEITQEAVVDGEVIVRVPVPNINLEQPGAEIDIQAAPATVDVNQAPASILVRQAPMNIGLEMPQPTITIEQPAPEITIRMPAPGVDVGSGQPQVSVNMPDPIISVTQPEPEVDVQVEARLVDPNTVDTAEAEGNVVTTTEVLPGENPDQPTANVQFTQAEPVVRLVETQEQAEVTVNAAEPQVQFESAEPVVTVTPAGEPVIELLQTGEPQIIFEQDEASAQQPAEQQAAEQQTAAAAVPVVEDEPELGVEAPNVGGAPLAGTGLTEEAPGAARTPLTAEESNRLLGTVGEAQQTEVVTVMAGDLEGRDVLGAGGEEIGDVSAVTTSGDRMYLLVEHGGFLGIGTEEVALPMERVALTADGQVMLLGLSEEDLEAMPEYNFEQDAEVGLDQTIEVNNIP